MRDDVGLVDVFEVFAAGRSFEHGGSHDLVEHNLKHSVAKLEAYYHTFCMRPTTTVSHQRFFCIFFFTFPVLPFSNEPFLQIIKTIEERNRITVVIIGGVKGVLFPLFMYLFKYSSNLLCTLDILSWNNEDKHGIWNEINEILISTINEDVQRKNVNKVLKSIQTIHHVITPNFGDLTPRAEDVTIARVFSCVISIFKNSHCSVFCLLKKKVRKIIYPPSPP